MACSLASPPTERTFGAVRTPVPTMGYRCCMRMHALHTAHEWALCSKGCCRMRMHALHRRTPVREQVFGRPPVPYERMFEKSVPGGTHSWVGNAEVVPERGSGGVYAVVPVLYASESRDSMARRQIYLPDELDRALKDQDINVSRVCREALARITEICPTCGQKKQVLPTATVKKEPPERKRVIRRPPAREQKQDQESVASRMERMERALASMPRINRRKP